MVLDPDDALFIAPFESGHVVGFELDRDRLRVVTSSILEWQGILLGHQVS